LPYSENHFQHARPRGVETYEKETTGCRKGGNKKGRIARLFCAARGTLRRTGNEAKFIGGCPGGRREQQRESELCKRAFKTKQYRRNGELSHSAYYRSKER